MILSGSQPFFDGGGVNTNESGDSHKGMGIGLSICKTIINAHGGMIQAANHADGAMFTFTYPTGRVLIMTTKANIIIIEDEKISAVLLNIF